MHGSEWWRQGGQAADTVRAWLRLVGSPWALLVGAGGAALLGAAPSHRLDLVGFGIIGVAIACWQRPPLGALLVGATIPLFFFDRRFGPVAFSLPGLILVVAWLALLARAAWTRVRSITGPRLAWPNTGYDGPLALLLLAALLSLLVTEYPLQSVRAMRALIFEPVLFFWLLASLRPWQGARLALGGFLLAAGALALAALIGLATGRGATVAEGVVRAQAWYPSPNHLALILGRAWPFLLALALTHARPGIAVARWAAASLVGLALLLTFSLGGWLASFVAALLVVARLARRRLVAGLGGLAGLAVLLGAALALAGRLPERLNPARSTSFFRFDLWLSSLEMVRDHPLLGVGMDNFVYLYQQVYLREGAAAEPNLSHPHNWLLNFWLELGLLGLAAFLWLQWRFWRAVWRSPRGWLAVGAAGSMADMLAHGLLDNSYFLVDLACVFWLTLALQDTLSQSTPPDP